MCLYTVTGWGVMSCVCGMAFLACVAAYWSIPLPQAGTVAIWPQMFKKDIKPQQKTTKQFFQRKCVCINTFIPLYVFRVIVRTAMRTMLSEWLKNFIASVYKAKSFVCCKSKKETNDFHTNYMNLRIWDKSYSSSWIEKQTQTTE